jgi:hypothetical protein
MTCSSCHYLPQRINGQENRIDTKTKHKAHYYILREVPQLVYISVSLIIPVPRKGGISKLPSCPTV